MMSKPLLRTALGSAALLLGLSLGGCSHPAATDDQRPMFTRQGDTVTIPDGSPLRQRLVIASVSQAEAPQAITAPASIDAEPSRTINILPPLAGHILRVNVVVGDTVHKGQVLAVLASGDMDQAYADDRKAKDALVLAQKALARTQGVKQVGGAAVKDLEAAQSTYNQAVAEASRAHARLVALGADSAKTGANTLPLVAPINGVVTTSIAAAGNNVTDPTASLMTLVDTSEVWATVNVPEAQIGQVKPGQDVGITLSSQPDSVLHGTVRSIDAVVQADTRRSAVRVVLNNADGRLRPNMFATAAIMVHQSGQILVPQSALLMNNDSVFVFVETAPWTFVRRAVDINYDDQPNTLVQSGLKPGERVITSGGVLLND